MPFIKPRGLSVFLKKKGFASPLLFFGVSFFLFIMGQDLTPSKAYLTVSKIFWTLTLFTALLSVEPTFQAEKEQGILDLWVLMPLSFPQILLHHLKAQLLFFFLPLLGIGGLASLLYAFSTQESLWFLASLAVGTLSLILIGLMIGSFKLGSQGGVMLMALLLFPLYLPVLIFGLSIPEALLHQGNPWTGMKGLLGLLLFNLPLCLLFGGWGLRQAVMH